MTIRKTLTRAAVVLLTAAAALTGAQSAAHAVDASGNTNLAGPGGRGYGGYYIDYDNNTVAVNVKANTLELGKCITLYLDAARVPGELETNGSETHLDPWIVRSCKSNTGRASGTQYAGATYGIDLVRPIHVLAVCYGPDNTLGTCNQYAGTGEKLAAMTNTLYNGMPCGQGYLVTANSGVYTYDTHHWTRCDA